MENSTRNARKRARLRYSVLIRNVHISAALGALGECVVSSTRRRNETGRHCNILDNKGNLLFAQPINSGYSREHIYVEQVEYYALGWYKQQLLFHKACVEHSFISGSFGIRNTQFVSYAQVNHFIQPAYTGYIECYAVCARIAFM